MNSTAHLNVILQRYRISFIVSLVIWVFYLSTLLLTQTLYKTNIEHVIADKASINNILSSRHPDIIYPVEDWGDGTLYRWNSGNVVLKILPVRYQYMMISTAAMAYHDDQDFAAYVSYSTPQHIRVDGIKSGFRTYHLLFLSKPQNWSVGNDFRFSIRSTTNNSIPIINDRKLALAISYIDIRPVSSDLQLALFEGVFSILWILLINFVSYLNNVDRMPLNRLLILAVVFHIGVYHSFLGFERYILYLVVLFITIFFGKLAISYQNIRSTLWKLYNKTQDLTNNRISFGALLLVIWTVFVTNLRAIRFPNDYAEAYWLIDYEFGYIKRGLIGTLSKVFGQVFSIQMTPELIIFFSSVSLVLMYVVLLYLLSRGFQRPVTIDVIVIGLMFATSPFVLMNAHVFGYFDSILYFLCIISVISVLRGQYFLASFVSTIAVFVHEAYVFIGFPLVLFAFIVHTKKTQTRSHLVFQIIAMITPLVCFFTAVLLQHSTTDMVLLRSQLAQHLDSFGFVDSQSRPIAYFQTTSFVAFFSEQYVLFNERLFDLNILSIISPTLIAIILYMYRVHGIPVLSSLSFLLCGVICAPLVMHLVAWDTARISTFTIGSAFIAWWILFETRKSRFEFDGFILISLFVIIYNTLGIMSCSVLSCTIKVEYERFSTPIRLLLYSPTLAFVVACITHTNRVSALIRWFIAKQ